MAGHQVEAAESNFGEIGIYQVKVLSDRGFSFPDRLKLRTCGAPAGGRPVENRAAGEDLSPNGRRLSVDRHASRPLEPAGRLKTNKTARQSGLGGKERFRQKSSAPSRASTRQCDSPCHLDRSDSCQRATASVFISTHALRANGGVICDTFKSLS